MTVETKKEEEKLSSSVGVDSPPLDEVKLSRFMIGVWILCAAVLFFDGYDIAVISFIAPELVKEFDFDKAGLGPLFSASLIGFALAGPVLGLIGDRYGRRLMIILSCFVFGFATLALLQATTITQMVLCRFIVGLGLGGALPMTTAMIAEFSPRRLRKQALALVSTAIPLGAMVPGILTAVLVPAHGWHILAILGGGVPVLLAICLIWTLPESIKYLALHPTRHTRLMALLKRLDPNLQWIPSPRGLENETAEDGSVRRLFAEGLLNITLSLWGMFFMNAMALYLVVNWLPLVLQSLGEGVQQAGQFSAMFAGGALIGGMIFAALISWAGVALLPFLFVIPIPFLLMFASVELSYYEIVLCVLVPGVSLGAIQVGCSTICGLLYPTTVRASGIGWGLGIGHIGAIFGPIVGSAVLGLQLSPHHMISLAAIPMVAGTVSAIVLTRLCHRRFGGFHVDESCTDKLPSSSGDRNLIEQPDLLR